MIPGFTRLRAVIGLASAQLHYYRVRSLLAALGVTVAVLLVVLLGGLGHGMLHTGGEATTVIGYDLWVATGPVALAPGTVGGVENPIHDAHPLSHELESHAAVREAQPLAFQTVYVSPDGEEFDTIVGVGGEGAGSGIVIEDGRTFNRSAIHYANGTYDGPMTHEIVVDERTANRYNLSVGDTLHVGATLTAAREHEFTVVGTTRTFQIFLGVPTVAMPLSELQEISGTTGIDSASLIALTLDPGANTTAVKHDLERRYATADIRTNAQQVNAIIGGHATIIAGTVTLVVLSIVVGVVLVVHALALLVYQQRRQLASMKAAGVADRTLVGLVTVQGAQIGLLGGLVGVAAAPLAAHLVNEAVERLTGYATIITTPAWLLAAGLCLAIIMGIVGSSVAGWRITRLSPIDILR